METAVVDDKQTPSSDKPDDGFEFTLAQDIGLAIDSRDSLLERLLRFPPESRSHIGFVILMGGAYLAYVGLDSDELHELDGNLKSWARQLASERRKGRPTAEQLAQLFVELRPDHVEFMSPDGGFFEGYADGWNGPMRDMLLNHSFSFKGNIGIQVAVRRRDRQDAERDLTQLLEQQSLPKWGSDPGGWPVE